MFRFHCVSVGAALVLLITGPVRGDLRFPTIAADLGEVRGSTPQRPCFEFVNDGPDPVEIVAVEPGCGCLAPQLDRRLLRPGEKGTLSVQLRTTGQANGPRSWHVQVRYRDGGAVKERLLTVAATIRNEVTVQPALLALYVTNELHQEVIVTDLRPEPLKVTMVRASSPAVRVTTELRGDGITRIVLDVAARDLGPGRQDALLSIYTDDPLYSPLQVPLTLQAASNAAVTATPTEARVRLASGQTRGSALVRLRPAGEAAIDIGSVEADGPGITCTWAAGPGNGATLKVQVDRGRLADAPGARVVRVRLSAPTREVIAIPVVIDPEK
jgi:Protein of unknown function (DUF1573)